MLCHINWWLRWAGLSPKPVTLSAICQHTEHLLRAGQGLLRVTELEGGTGAEV